MQVEISTETEAVLRSLMTGNRTPEQLVESAIHEMAQRASLEREQANEGIRKGLAEVESGQTEPWSEFIDGFREEHGFTADA